MIYLFFILTFIALIYCVDFISKIQKVVNELERSLMNAEYIIEMNRENIEEIGWLLAENEDV